MSRLKSLGNWLLVGGFGVAFVVYLAASPEGPRIGARCDDGWRSRATGSGACSYHGGVDHWLRREEDPPFDPAIGYWVALGLSASGLGLGKLAKRRVVLPSEEESGLQTPDEDDSLLPTSEEEDLRRDEVEEVGEMVADEEVDAVAARALADFPAGTIWKTPDGYPNSLALCIVDSVWSIGVHYDRNVVPVLNRYRALARVAGRSGREDGPVDLVEMIRSLGGPEKFADAVGSHHRTSPTSGILKAEAVLRAATIFVEKGVATTAEVSTRLADLKPGWHSIPGQRSGVSWKYLLMLAGVEGIKPDRMIHAYLDDVLGYAVSSDEAVEILVKVQQSWPEPRPTLLQLDHAIWRRQSGRGN